MQRAPTATPATVYAQAFALHRHGRFQDASRLLDAMLARWPDHVDARNLAGVLRMRLGDTDCFFTPYSGIAIGTEAERRVTMKFEPRSDDARYNLLVQCMPAMEAIP